MAGRKDIIDAVQSSVEGITQRQADDVFRAVLDYIEQSLAEGGPVLIPGFGRFSITERAARNGRNPATGEEIQIPASKAVRFKPAKQLKDAVQD